MIDFKKYISKKSKPQWPKIIATETYTGQRKVKRSGLKHETFIGSANVVEREDGERLIDFGGFWQYGKYIYQGHGPEVTEMVKGTSLEFAVPADERTGGRWMLDMGGNGTEVWLEAAEYHRIFVWAKPYMLGKK